MVVYGVYQGSYSGGGIDNTLYKNEEEAIKLCKTRVKVFDLEIDVWNKDVSGSKFKKMRQVDRTNWTNGMEFISVKEFKIV